MEEDVWKGRLERCKWMTQEDKEMFLRFAEDAALREIGNKRVDKYRVDLVIAHGASGRNLHGMVGSIEGLKATIARINSSHAYAAETKSGCKRTLGSIYCFIHNKERSMKYAPREIKELVKHRVKPSDRRLAKAIITREEMREMLQFGNTLDRAIITMLFDSGMRIGEFVQLRKSDLKQIEEGLDVRVPPGKTGERMVVVIEAKHYVNAWLEQHPDKSEDGPLWLSLDTKKPLGAAGIAKRLVETVRRMNECRKKNGKPQFTKSVNPHNFRHSRATELGGEPGMTEQILCKVFGWDVGSDMPGTYLHLTEEQVRRAVLRVHGRAREDAPKQIETHRICRLCRAENPIGLHYCGTCGKPLAVDEQVSKMGDMEARMLKMEQFMIFMADDIAARKSVDPNSEEGQLLQEIQVDWTSLIAKKVWEKNGK